ncbi:MAG: efflux RND transporter periplasmic adaptor subunit [Gammaproteobacteria bacterium]|nr:efflux RND transporter periplasmic adaptor subunit [Gammaproteobacteria bacterium]
MHIFKYFLLMAFVLATGVPELAMAQGAGGGAPPAAVRIAEARIAELAPTIEVPGTVASRFDARLAAEVSGRLITVADIGEMVEEGGIVAGIDDTNYRLQKAESEGEVARSQSRIAFLAREARRLEKLAAQNVAAKSQLDATESDLQVARKELEIARARLGLAEVELNVTKIKAPFSGVVSERFKFRGERVSAGDTVVRLVNQEAIEVVARAPLSSVSYVEVGDELALFNDRLRSQGMVRTLVPVGDPRSHMFEMRIDIPAADWRIGETVRVVVPSQAREARLAVPRDALVLRRDSTSVYRVTSDNMAERIEVATGVSSGGWVAVSGDLREGDRIIIRGAERLRPGQPVSILGGDPGAAGSDARQNGASENTG